MIEIKNLNKVYKGNKQEVRALDNVSFVLPDKGLVFVLGKSGSGKSTLLNMIGGLDSPTSGDILVDGVSVVNLSNNKLDMYRNNYVGIIYQNFNLFANESVKTNILEAALISNKKIREEDIVSLCKKLDLEGKERQPIKNLSGGQKQRVAIARSLIKDPKIILADEPTGNLDSKTTSLIFDTLKDIAKDKLVIVISHDVVAARKYGERIIYLSDGKVIYDVIKNENYNKNDENLLELPNNHKLDEEDIKKINKSLKKYNLQVGKKSKEFVDNEIKEESIKKEFSLAKEKKTMNLAYRVSNKFFKSTWISFIATLLMLTFIIGILSVSQTLAQFDTHIVLKKVSDFSENKSLILNKGYSYYKDINDINKKYQVEITDEDIEIFRNSGYKGNIYEIYNTPVLSNGVNMSNEYGLTTSNEDLYLGVYAYASLGTVICDLSYLEYLFGEVKVLAGSIDYAYDTSALIVTDYFADSLLAIDRISNVNQFTSNDINNPYAGILGYPVWSRYTIGAIIDTGYKEKYKSLFQKAYKLESESHNKEEISKELLSDKENLKFFEEASSSLNFTYSFNENFFDDYIEETTGLAVWVKNAFIEYNSGSTREKITSHVYEDESLQEDTMLMSLPMYNRLFNKNVTMSDLSDFEEKEITIYNYSYSQDTKDDPRSKITLTVVGVIDFPEVRMGHVDTKTHKTLAKDSTFKYALMFDNVEDALLVSEIGKENYYYPISESFSKAFDMCNIINIFSDIFVLIAVILIILELIILLSFNLRTIKKNQYRIGVYKSLGCSNKVFVVASLLNTLILVGFTLLTSFIFINIVGDYVNDILVTNLVKFINLDIISEITFVSFNIYHFSLYMIIILLVSLISMLEPIMKFKKMKPNLILNKSE